MVDEITSKKDKVPMKKKMEESDLEEDEDIHTFNHVSKYYDENYYNEE